MSREKVVINSWKHIGSKDYYFAPNGVMAVNQWIGSYYVGSDGAWIPNLGKTAALPKAEWNRQPEAVPFGN